ncbi:lysophospholipid acyltransferase family protein [Luteimicrobium subarcticum]|uniref:1-acyl-sn-glycerol-3-phosphate acyltransferase n=1 Tax=Luteimicrobium subarcticum TaxID=620910 RepID=A0A2M8WV46_9MICO|nr:lysophospholipid acyltransferase family protein [Luteimicrobium subarcticum]PJI94789.1 1-acyl-sn-glycerol-3-phosphate acyltransferase [Luteimicrobium subarcticum]
MTGRRRVGLPAGTSLPALLRHRLWRGAFQAAGGFRVVGRAPVEAMVLVANHSSHADTPAVLAAFPAPYRPVAAAAGDYWFADPLRSWLARTFVGAVPLDRSGGGGYAALSEEAAHVLGHGRSLLLYSEGTRSVDGDLGDFRSGAMHLAREYDVPLLPVAIVGTHDLLPKGGRLAPAPVEVRLGTPVAPEEWDERGMDVVRDQIRELLARGPARPTTSALWRRTHRFMAGRAGLAGAFGWGFAEAVSWPVTNEMFLAIFAAAHPRRVPATVAALTAGSVAGVLVTTTLTARGARPPAPLTTPSMRATAREHMAVGARGIWRQALNGVPVKLYAQAAADEGVPRVPLALHAIGARGARAVVVGAAVGVAATRARPFLKRFFGPYEVALAGAYVAGFAVVARRWRRD